LEDTAGPNLKSKSGDTSVGSIGMGPGRTGVKGVIRDRHEHDTIQKETRRLEVEEMNARLKGMSLGGLTFSEEESQEKRKQYLEELDAERRGKKSWELELEEELDTEKDWAGKKEWTERYQMRREFRSGRFGHLREVGVGGYVGAVEERGVWVIVHLYDSVRIFQTCFFCFQFLSFLIERAIPSITMSHHFLS